jgi:stalled ribosome rescue protein Dom34
MSYHAVVWLDQQEARVISVNAEGFDEASIHAPAHHIHRHPKGPNQAKEHPEDTKRFFHDLAQALAGYQEILLVGPATAKLHFVKYVHKNAHDLEPKIVGVETVDHPTDAQIVAYAKKYFLSADLYR